MAEPGNVVFRRKYKAVMYGCAAGAASFLVVRYLFQVSVDIGLVVFGFFSFSVATFLWNYRPPNKEPDKNSS